MPVGHPGSGAEQQQRGQGECDDGARSCREGQPLSARGQGRRDKQAEMRLVGKCAEQHTGQHRPALEQHRRGREQGGGQKCVLAKAKCPEHGGRGESRNRPAPAGLAEDGAQRQQKQRKRDRFEDNECGKIRQRRDRPAEQKVYRRIEEVLVRNARLGRALLGGEMRRLVIGKLRLSMGGECARRIETDEVGRGRPIEAHDQAVRSGDEEKEPGEFEREQHPAAQNRGAAREPVAAGKSAQKGCCTPGRQGKPTPPCLWPDSFAA